MLDIDECIGGLREEMIAFTSELVAVASETRRDRITCVRVIASRLRELGLPCERLLFRTRKGPRDESGAAVVLTGIGSGRGILFLGPLRRRPRHHARPVHPTSAARRCSGVGQET